MRPDHDLRRDDAGQPGAPPVSAVALATTLATGAFTISAAGLEIAVGRTEGAESALFLLTFGGLLPLATFTAVRLARRRLGPLVPGAVPAVAAVSAFALVTALAVARLLDGIAGSGAPGVLLALMAGWVVVTFLASRGRAVAVLRARAPGLWSPSGLWLPVLAVPMLVAVFASASLLGAGAALATFLIGACLFALHSIGHSLGGRAAVAFDVAAAVLIVLVVSDVWVYTTYAATQPEPSLGGGQVPGWVTMHHNAFLGSVNDVLHGRAMLVDSFSIYGIGNIYALAALFSVVPIGYGTFGLFLAAGFALLYALAYAVLRLAGCSGLTAAAALAGAVITSIFARLGSVSTFPALGPQRWWASFAVLLFAVLAVRRPGRSRPLGIAMVVVVALSSVWSFEAFAYCSATFAAVVACDALTRPRREGFLAAVGRPLGLATLAVAAAQLALALATLAASGELPAWGTYAAFLREFSVGPQDAYQAVDWWPGLLYAGFFFASAVALATLLITRRPFEEEDRVALVAMAGLVAFGIVTFTYASRFSVDDGVLQGDLVGFMLGALWIELARRSAAIPRAVRTGAAAFGFLLVGWFVVLGWGEFSKKVDHSALVQLLPGQEPWIDEDLRRTWSNPPIDARAPEADRLLDRYWPDQSEALVLLFPELSAEALVRSDRVNVLPVGDFYVEDIARQETADRLAPVLERLKPGTLMLTESFYLTPGSRRDYVYSDEPMLPLERIVIRSIRERFHLETVRATESRLMVMRLVPRG